MPLSIKMNITFKQTTIADRLSLEFGESLSLPVMHYLIAGEAEAPRRIIWVAHALTANANVFEWWPGLFGVGKIFDPQYDLIICPSILGSCYGSTGPLSTNPDTNVPYFHGFPFISVRDMALAQVCLMEKLGIHRLDVLVGASLGGQQALEMAYLLGGRVKQLILLATNARHSPWGIAFNAAQRMAIAADPTWRNHQPDAGSEGLKAARAIALMSYRHYQSYQQTQFDADEKYDAFKADTYQRYQGEKLAKRFNAFSYWTLSKAMDSHHIGRGRGGVLMALSKIEAETLVIGIEQDILFPIHEQRLIAAGIPRAKFCGFQSPYGHDAFLTETACIQRLITQF